MARPERLTRDEVAHVAALARLDLTEEELDLFTGQLAQVLDHAADVSSLDLAGVAPTAHAMAVTNVLRPDEVAPCLDREEVLAQAPVGGGPPVQGAPHPGRSPVSSAGSGGRPGRRRPLRGPHVPATSSTGTWPPSRPARPRSTPSTW